MAQAGASLYRYLSVEIMPSLWNEQFEVENSCKDCNYERVEEVLYRRKI